MVEPGDTFGPKPSPMKWTGMENDLYYVAAARFEPNRLVGLDEVDAPDMRTTYFRNFHIRP